MRSSSSSSSSLLSPLLRRSPAMPSPASAPSILNHHHIHTLNNTHHMTSITKGSGQWCRDFATIPKYSWGVPTRLSVGDECHLTKSFTSSDVYAFGRACGDWNPVHFPDQHFETTSSELKKFHNLPENKDQPLPTTGIFRFTQPIVHGMLTASLIGTLFASHLPGSIYMQQSLQFRAPVFYDEPVTARIEVVKLEGRKRVTCKTTVEKMVDGKVVVVIEGEAKVLVETLES